MSSLMFISGLKRGKTTALPEDQIDATPISATDAAVNTAAVMGVFASIATGPLALLAAIPKALQMVSSRFSKKSTSDLAVPLLPMNNKNLLVQTREVQPRS